MSSCYLFSLHVVHEFLSLKCFMHTLVKHGQGAVCCQYRASRRVQTQSGRHRLAVLLAGPLQHGVVPPAWWRHSFDVRPTCPRCGTPCLACLIGAGLAASCWGWAPAGVSSSCAHIRVWWQAPENKKEDCL